MRNKSQKQVPGVASCPAYCLCRRRWWVNLSVARHVDLSRVQELLANYPSLIHAAFDWGNGDWETALGRRHIPGGGTSWNFC